MFTWSESKYSCVLSHSHYHIPHVQVVRHEEHDYTIIVANTDPTRVRTTLREAQRLAVNLFKQYVAEMADACVNDH